MAGSESDTSYYVRIRGKILGPFDVGQLKTLRSRGQFGRANEISNDRVTWQSASTIEHLFAESSIRKRSSDTFEDEEPEATVTSSSPPNHSLSSVWYYAIGEEQSGPVSLLEIRKLIASHQLCVDDLVWKDGLADWVPIRDVSELNAIAKIAPPAQASPVVFMSQNFCFACGSPTDPRAEMCPKCGVRQRHRFHPHGSERNRMTAALLALLLGGLGIHHFYLGNIGRGIVYAVFFWTFIPAILALFDLIHLLFMSDATFDRRYRSG